MKRIITLALFLIVSLSVVLNADVTIDGIEYQIDSYTEKATVLKLPEDIVTADIPEEITFTDRDGITRTYPVTSITVGAFWGCSKMTSLTIPASVTSISSGNLEDCVSLSSITFSYGEEILELGDVYGIGSCFTNLPRLKKLHIGRAIETYNSPLPPFEGSGVTSVTFDERLWVITGGLLAGLEKLESLEIPSHIELVMPGAFDGDILLKNVSVAGSSDPLYMVGGFGTCGIEVLNIDRPLYYGDVLVDGVAYDCYPSFGDNPSLTTINFGSNFTEIVPSMFKNCTNLRSVTIPPHISLVGDRAFEGCRSLKSVNIEDSPSELTIESSTAENGGGTTFATAPIETMYLGRNIKYKSTELSPFKNLTTLTTLTIGNKVTAINDYLFYGCSSISAMSVPASVKSIGNYSFYDCSGSRSLLITRSVETIGEYAFYNCKELRRLSIPESVTSIGDYAFRSCSKLETIRIGNGVETIGNYAFLDCFSAKEITIGSSVKSIGNNAFFNCSAMKNINIPNSVKSIGDNAFVLCTGLSSATIGDGVETVGLLAFSDCENIKTLTIGASVKNIASGAFVNCDNIEEINCRPQTPPDAGEDVFTSYNAKLYVPTGKSAEYKDATGTCWPLFGTIAEKEFSGIESIEYQATDSTKGDLFNLNGVCLKHNADKSDLKGLMPGIYILNGEKIVVK